MSRIFRGIALTTFSLLASIQASAKPYSQPEVTDAVQIKAAQGVLERLIPGISKKFRMEIIPTEEGKDVFEIEGRGNKIILRGSSGVSLCSAFNWYLKHSCKCSVSWCGDQLNIPSPLPKVAEKIRMVSPNKKRVYLNYTVFSYTMTGWDWTRWQREIDWMALNGINMVLAATGIEATWYYTLREFEFDDLEARTFLCDPAYMAWQWMSNLEGLGGPLPMSVIKKRIVLARKILEQERSLGITPIQQGFSGHVPNLLKKKYPDSHIGGKHGWSGGIPTSSEIDPMDPLFNKMAKSFYANQKKLFGTSHVYAADPFHEGRPRINTPEYLGSVGENVFKMMMDSDPKAIWAMQTWSIREAIATTVPKDRLLILDLQGTRVKMKQCKQYWGYQYILGSLENFGGRTRVKGSLSNVAARSKDFLIKQAPETFAGVGLFMEGIERNPVYFDLFTDMIWRDESIDAKSWLYEYAERRYGKKSENAEKAWDILVNTAYKSGGIERSSFIAARPRLHLQSSGPMMDFRIMYSNAELQQAWELLLKDSDLLKGSDGYRFDVVDFGRQVLSDIARGMHRPLMQAFIAKDTKTFKELKTELLAVFDDIDRMVGTRKESLVGKWIEDAARWGDTPEEQDKLAFNATMLVTQWGTENESENAIFDYGWREWNGLVGGYYKGRWAFFLDYLEECLEKGIEYNDSRVRFKYTQQAMNSNDFFKSLTKWENRWIKNSRRHGLLTKPTGDAVEIALALSKKYAGKAAIYKDIPYLDQEMLDERAAKAKAIKEKQKRDKAAREAAKKKSQEGIILE